MLEKRNQSELTSTIKMEMGCKATNILAVGTLLTSSKHSLNKLPCLDPLWWLSIDVTKNNSCYLESL